MAQSSENTKVNDAAAKTPHEVDSKVHDKLLNDSNAASKTLPDIVGSSSKLHEIDPSSPENTKKAEDALDSKVSGLLPQADQALLKSMNHAVVEGDTKALGAAIASMKDDPAKLKSFIDELNKNLKQGDAGVNVSVTKDGNVVTYKDGDTAGVQYDSKTGKPSVVPIENQDGNVILGQGEVLNKTPDDVAKDIGLSAREGLLGLSLKFPSIFKELPGYPGDHLPVGRGSDPGWNQVPDRVPPGSDPGPHYPEPNPDVPIGPGRAPTEPPPGWNDKPLPPGYGDPARNYPDSKVYNFTGRGSNHKLDPIENHE